MKIPFLFRLIATIIFLLLFSSCDSEKPLPAIEVEEANLSKEGLISFAKEIKPILDARCVVCHSCYNSPCQLKFSSYEGLMRGGSKALVYDGTRLEAIAPTRLFIDANSTKEWRDKGFFSVAHSSATQGKSNALMVEILDAKKHNPEINGVYAYDYSNYTCAKNTTELNKMLKKNPSYGMPYGFPALKESEYQQIAKWIEQGAKGPTEEEQQKQTQPSSNIATMIDKFETFLNQEDAKHQMSARYIYEHLYLGHINFSKDSQEFFELLRSYTPPGKPLEIINTVLPLTLPGKDHKIYYRFRKVHTTIVKKTHTIYTMSSDKLQRYHELFMEPKWDERPHLMGYEIEQSANPFFIYKQIPARSRYLFLLDDVDFFVQTFIKGPVCDGQVALDVIQDHFWVMFMDPEYDLSLKNSTFMNEQIKNLSLPNALGSNPSLIALSNNDYRDGAVTYYKEREKLYAKYYKEGMKVEYIWKGNEEDSAPMITVLRHFDSGSSHKGALGNLPKTAWVIDFPLLERIYYSLVAGFDIFGNISHQLKIRMYMDRLRIEGESYFLSFVPREQRKEIFQAWYKGFMFSPPYYYLSDVKSAVLYKRDDPIEEFMTQVVNGFPEKVGIQLDSLNYAPDGNRTTPPKNIRSNREILQALQSLDREGTAFVKAFNGDDANVVFVKVEREGQKDFFFSIVINRWHNNVDYLITEEMTLDHTKDTIFFSEEMIGSYPNLFFVVKEEMLTDFLTLISQKEDYDAAQKEKLMDFALSRGSERFWSKQDHFQQWLQGSDTENEGLFDLNKYHTRAF